MMYPQSKSSSAPAKPEPTNIIIDSGAYSAWRSGKPIDLDKYCDYLLANLDWMTTYVALDVINPGRPEEAAQASFDNLLHMRKRGLDPVPVFHVGEHISWLHRMLDLGCSYIGLSASSLVSRNLVDDWYGLAWSHLVNSRGSPFVKAHAFGEGRVESLKQFPWYSADTTSWIYAAQRTGQATMPGGRNVSMRNDFGGSKSSPDITSLPEAERVIWDKFVKDSGISPAALSERGQTATIIRTYITALYYLQCQSDVRALQPIRHRSQGFFCDLPKQEGAIPTLPFNLHLVCGTNNMAYALLAKLRHPNMLASYFYIDSPDPTTKAIGGYKFKSLRDFVLDPITHASTMHPWSKYWKVLEEYIK